MRACPSLCGEGGRSVKRLHTNFNSPAVMHLPGQQRWVIVNLMTNCLHLLTECGHVLGSICLFVGLFI